MKWWIFEGFVALRCTEIDSFQVPELAAPKGCSGPDAPVTATGIHHPSIPHDPSTLKPADEAPSPKPTPEPCGVFPLQARVRQFVHPTLPWQKAMCGHITPRLPFQTTCQTTLANYTSTMNHADVKLSVTPKCGS
jgi:hypothetical protein